MLQDCGMRVQAPGQASSDSIPSPSGVVSQNDYNLLHHGVIVVACVVI